MEATLASNAAEVAAAAEAAAAEAAAARSERFFAAAAPPAMAKYSRTSADAREAGAADVAEAVVAIDMGSPSSPGEKVTNVQNPSLSVDRMTIV